MEHFEVYRRQGRFAAWPANYGIWSWDDEVVVNFTTGYLDTNGGFHARDRNRPFTTMQARSVNGGRTWDVVPCPCPLPLGRAACVDEQVVEDLRVGHLLDEIGFLLPPPGDIDFAHRNFALMCARTGLRAGARSWFYISYDRCHTWQGPYELPMFGYQGVSARTDYVVTSSTQCTLFLTGTKKDGTEGTTFCARTDDAGRTFQFHSAVGPEPVEGYAIMPASVLLPDGTWLVAIRRVKKPEARIELYASRDDAQTWTYVTTPVANTGRAGNPPSLTLLEDGRLCIVYGYRDYPYGIRAVLSEDGGESWSDPIILRDDGGSADIGYPRTVELPEGELLTVYYYNDHPEGERYIAATVWRP